MIATLVRIEDDLPMRRFFSLLEGFCHEEFFEGILINILKKRPTMTEEHLAYLIYASLQYVSDFSYDHLSEGRITEYREKLRKDLVSHSETIQNLCFTKNVCTNMHERYVALQIILSMLGKESLVVVDLGCSIGLGLMSLNMGAFQNVEVADEMLKKHLQNKVNIAKLIGIDIKEDVENPDMKWVMSCFLPKAKDYRSKLEETYEWLRKDGQVFDLVKGDITDLRNIEGLSPHSADVAWMSNTCYQIREEDVAKVEEGLKWLLKIDGISLYSYYRDDYDAFATSENPYVVRLRRADKWDDPLEVFQSPCDVVKAIEPGVDFKRFLRTISS